MWCLTKHWVACSSNPALGCRGWINPGAGVKVLASRLGNPKIAAKVAVRPSVLITVKF